MEEKIDFIKVVYYATPALKALKTSKNKEYTQFDTYLLMKLFYRGEKFAITAMFNELYKEGFVYFRSKFYDSIYRLEKGGLIELLPKGVRQYVNLTNKGARYLDKYRKSLTAAYDAANLVSELPAQ